MPEFEQDELDRLCRSAQERLREAMRGDSPVDVVACFVRLLGMVRDIADLYSRWSVATLSWLQEQHGLAAAAEAVMYTEFWPAVAPRLDTAQLEIVHSALRGRDDALEARMLLAAETGDADAVVALWEEVHRACDLAETLRRDALTAQLTFVTERYGAEGLEGCLRHTTDLVWAPRMAADLAYAPADRLRNWAEKMAIGHSGSVRVRELSDRWVITLDPCGSCGRQLLSGRYEPPWNFAMVPPGERVGFLRDDISVYQAHLAVAHTLVPIERTGAPWPAISCAGRAARPCELVLFRDPSATDESYYAQVGATRN
jgi:hypothetical protein